MTPTSVSTIKPKLFDDRQQVDYHSDREKISESFLSWSTLIKSLLKHFNFDFPRDYKISMHLDFNLTGFY